MQASRKCELAFFISKIIACRTGNVSVKFARFLLLENKDDNRHTTQPESLLNNAIYLLLEM
jgi:hypothetical protein